MLDLALSPISLLVSEAVRHSDGSIAWEAVRPHTFSGIAVTICIIELLRFCQALGLQRSFTEHVDMPT